MNKGLFWVRNVTTGRKEGPFQSKKEAKEIRRKLNGKVNGHDREVFKWVVSIGPGHWKSRSTIGTSAGYAKSRVYK